jgi:O-antigen/teichoic acid export membrane protein
MSFAKKSFSVFLRDIFLFFSAAVVSVILARSLGPHFLGLWFALNLIPSYAELFGRIKLDLAAVYYLSKGNYSLKEVIPVINLFAILLSLAIIGLYLIFFNTINIFLFKEFAEDMKFFALLILFQIPLNFLYMNYLYMHIYKEDKNVVNKMVLLRSLVSFLIILSTYIYSGFTLDIVSVLIATFTGILVALIYGIYQAKRHIFITLLPERHLTKVLFSYGLKVYVTGIFSYFNIYSIQFLVLALLSPIQMGLYTIAQQNSQLFQKVSDAISVFLFPLIIKIENIQEKIAITLKIFRTLLLILLPCLMLAFIFLEPLVRLTYGSKYLPVIIPIFIILPAIVLATAVSPLSTFFQSCGKPQLATKALIIPLFFQIVLGYFIIPKGGVIAASLCFSFGSVSASVIQLLILKHQFEIPKLIPNLIIKKEDVLFVWNFAKTTFKIRNI